MATEDKEIEITPAMIDAGAEEARAWLDEYDCPCGSVLAGIIARDVLSAGLRAAVKPPHKGD